jgi:hypothetical protein
LRPTTPGEIRTLLAGKDQGIGDRDEANIVPADANAIAFPCSPAEVLGIVYLGGEASGFGFFPNRLNGPTQ